MCGVRCVKISVDEHGFAVRMHKPSCFCDEVCSCGQVCSTWIIFSYDAVAVQNSLGFGSRPCSGSLFGDKE